MAPIPVRLWGFLSGDAVDLLASVDRYLATIEESGRPLWPGSRFTDVDRLRATFRGLQFIYHTALDEDNFEQYAEDLIWCFYTISVSVQDANLRDLARHMGIEFAHRWRRDYPSLPQDADPGTIVAFVVGNDVAERLDVHDDRLREQLEHAVTRFSARDFHSFDPRSEPPPDNVPEDCAFDGTNNPPGSKFCCVCKRPLVIKTRYDVWYEALVATYIGDHSGIKLGAHYEDVFKWLPSLRPYRGSENDTNLEFHDTVYAVTHIVYTLNDYNSYKLSPRWLPREYDFLKASLPEAIKQEEDDMLAEIMDSLRAFGLTNDDELIRDGMEYLLTRQGADGGWGSVESKYVYARYHKTWGAITALSDYAAQEYSLRLGDELMPFL